MIAKRLKHLGLSGALVGAGMLLGGVAHAADDNVATQSESISTVTESSVVDQSTTVVLTSDSNTPPTNTDAIVPDNSTPAVANPQADSTTNQPASLLTPASDETPVTIAGPVGDVPLLGATVRNDLSPYVLGFVPMSTATMSNSVRDALEQSTVAKSTAQVQAAAVPIQPAPVLPPAGSLELVGVWSSVILPLFTWFNPSALASHSASWPLALLIVSALGVAMCASFVSILKRSGYARAARSDAAATHYFATPSLNVSLIGILRPV